MMHSVRVTSPYLGAITGGLFVILAFIDVVSKVLHGWIWWLPFGGWSVLALLLLLKVITLASHNPTLSFGENALEFPQKTIDVNHVERIVIFKNFFLVKCKQNRMSVNVYSKRSDFNDMVRELKQWALTNHVSLVTKTEKA
ncbi:hypothetical protein JZ785_01955 [Alicyclobacillus curvatus]|nr:hypothetical protein JZ785_01955 [Alicyclobacillus curvatus]